MAQFKLACADLGDGMCDFVTSGDTPEEIKQNMYAHVAKAHPEKLKTMTEAEMKSVDELMDKLLAWQN